MESSQETSTLKCPISGCTWEYESRYSDEFSVKLISMHVENDHNNPQQSQPAIVARTPKLEPPKVEAGVDRMVWQAFVLRWKQYVVASSIDERSQSSQLLDANKTLGDTMLLADPNITSYPPDVVLKELEKLAVIHQTKGVARGELMKMAQGSDEPIRRFASKVQGKALICEFSMQSKCSQCESMQHVDYTSEVVKDVILAGIGDPEIRASVLDIEGIDEKSVNDLVATIERKEKSRSAYSQSGVSAISSFKRSQTSDMVQSSTRKQPPKQSPKVPCPTCKRPYRRFNGRNSKAFEFCIECFRKGRGKREGATSNNALIAQQPDEARAVLLQDNNVSKVHVFNRVDNVSNGACNDKVRLCNVSTREHPKLSLRLRVAAHESGLVPVVGIADTGAQSNIWGLSEFLSAGFSKDDLQHSHMTITAANNEPLPIVGRFLAYIEGDGDNGFTASCKAIIYVSEGVTGLFISFDTLISLCVVNSSFPTIGGIPNEVSGSGVETIGASQLVRSISSGCPTQPCSCPPRSHVPNKPLTLPFQPTPENVDMMRNWLLKYFEASTFNTCPHQPLQEMSGPPVEIHVDPDATPRVCHTPARIPLHWREQVLQDIKRDQALGILEEVPYGEPVTWCHRMVVTRKHDGSPRRTVDLSPLNKHCKRETHAGDSPFHLARRIPNGVWKTVCDAWNGYHSMPLRESDKHLTTFITPFGRFRYTRAPQGFLSSGDGYNRRFAAILEGFPRLERCIDDTIFFDDNLESHWWRTIDFLIMVGKSGIVLNPDKFKFCQIKVPFAGFNIGSQKVEPLPKYLNAIKMFPTPRTSTDIRSWFGLVNQLSSYAQLRDVMEPFRPFLSSKVKFYWDEKLNQAFETSKDFIVNSIKHGVQIFDMNKPVCLRPDWSKKGIGYVLIQKHCDCDSELPDCCDNGWKIVLAGSRFLSSTESRYAAVEGEALAIVYGLEQTRFFTQGCDDLLVVTDHKPLVKVFGDRTLDEITNTRLFRLKQRTLQWRFKIAYSPGKSNFAADAASRNPWPRPSNYDMSLEDLAEQATVAAMHDETAKVACVSWDVLALETQKDPILLELMTAISEGFQGSYNNLSEYVRYKNSLFVQNGVIIYQDRAVIPEALRNTVLDSLHAAHQGVSGMQARAQSIVFWPGMTKDILRKREECSECCRNAPSQAPLPSEPANPPSCPFQQIFADFFDFGGYHYLIAGDRLSGYTEVFFTPSGTQNAGAKGLVKCLRRWFATFGVPEELASDGGPEFSAEITSRFLKSWGVSHRVSAAYNPSSNGRAEVAVKRVKRLMRGNVGPLGSLDNDRFLKAMLHLRNTPDPDCEVSPAEIVFGRTLRDNLSFSEYLNRSKYSKNWQDAWVAKEEALRARFIRTSEVINRHARPLPPLLPGHKCFIQNQTGPHANKWHNTGTVMECLPHNKYAVRVDGSGRVTVRNRRFLKRYSPPNLTVPNPSYGYDIQDLKETNAVPDTWTKSGSSDVPIPVDDASPRPLPIGNTTSTPSYEDHTTPTLLDTTVLEPIHTIDVQHPNSSLVTEAKGSRKKLPLALRRLQDFNSRGLKE